MDIDNVTKNLALLVFSGTGIVVASKLLKTLSETSKHPVPKLSSETHTAIDDQSNNVRENIIFPHQHEKRMNERLQRQVEDENDHKERTKVVVKVPATSANLGPGFDSIGMALDMWSEFTVERSDKFEIICEGDGSYDMPLDETNLVCVGMAAAFKKAGKEVPPLKYRLINNIPYARGLGSSSAAIVGGLLAGLVLAGHQLPAWGSEELLNMACEIEGHPDNVAPALYGGVQLGNK